MKAARYPTIAVCTRDAGPGLAQTLASVDADAPAEAELLVVLNGTDGSAPPPRFMATIEALQRPARVVLEPAAGAARARTRALVEATSDVVLFTDDDAVVRPGWYAALADAMGSGAAAAGGRVLAVWPPGEPPVWLPAALRVFYGERAAGPEAKHPPFAANMALRRSAVDAVGGMRAELGPRGGRPGLHAETDLCERLERAGLTVGEVPGAVVEHVVRPEQVRVGWVLRRAWHEGRSDAVRDRARGERDAALRVAKLAGLLLALPLAIGMRSRGIYLVARITSNAGYLSESATG